MSFYTSLKYYRPGRAPKVHGEDIAQFLEAFSGLGVVDQNERCMASMKSGRGIDQDERPTAWTVPTEPSGYIREYREIEWDIDDWHDDLPTLIAAVRSGPTSIYRGHLLLGAAVDPIVKKLTRDPSPENSWGLVLWDWSMHFDSVEIYLLDSDVIVEVGWIDIAISGNGYLYPWSFSDLLARVDACEELRRVEALCRQFWPVGKVEITPELIAMRRQLGDLWPYAVDVPFDWAWGVGESG